MNKIKSLSQILISLYLTRLLITGASLGDALVMLGLSSVYGYFLHLEAKSVALEALKEPEVNIDIKNRLAEMEKSVQLVSTKMGALQIRR